MRRRRSLADWFFDNGAVVVGTGVGLVVLALILALPIYTWACYHNDRWQTCTVVDKDRAGKDATMRVYTADCGNLVVQDATFAKNFHSSDTYREIVPGHTYRMHVNGYRIPFLSEFPNILEVQEVAG